MKRESGLATLACGLLALFFLNTLVAAPAASRPTKPNFARVKAVSPFEIDLNWRDRSGDADGYQIERSTNRKDFRQIAEVQPGTTVFRDKNLFPGTQYFYRIRSFNASGTSRYDTTSARTQTPTVPLSVAEWGGPLTLVTPTNRDLVSVAAGAFFGIGLKKDGTVIGWGDNTYGQSTPPTNLSGVIAIAAGQASSLALKNDGTVVEWGFEGVGGVRNSPPPVLFPPPRILLPSTNLPRPPISIPIEIQPLRPIQPAQPIFPPVSPIQLNPQPQSQPRLSAQSRLSVPSDLTGIVAIAAGAIHNLALKGDGTVVGWGVNTYGQATPPADLSNVVAIAAGQLHSLALKSDGTVVQWGYNLPVPTNLNSVVAIAAGSGLSAAVRADGTVVAWGFSGGSQQYPAVNNLTNVAAVALGTADGITLNKDGSLSNWIFSPTFELPDLGTSVVTISANMYHHLALSTAPAAPQNPFITILSATQLRLSWQDNSSDEKSFAIERISVSEDSISPWAQIGTVGPNHTTFIDKTVQTNVTYSYRIRAINKFGTSPYSTSINAIVAPLTAPSDLFAALGSTNEVNLSWFDVFSGMDSFKIERALDNNGQPGAWSEIASVTVTNYIQNTFTDKTAQPNTIYWYRVRAANVLGFSDYSAAASINVAPPTTPQFFFGTPYADSLMVSWSLGASAHGTKVERAPDINGAPGAWMQIAIIDTAGGGHYTETNLPLNTTYWYRVRAYNWIGDSDYAGPIKVTVVPPAPPSTVRVDIGITDGVDISWYPNINDEDGFKLERAVDIGGGPGAWTEIASFNDQHITSESYHDTNVLANTTYWYRLRSFNLFGFSDYSTPVSVSLVPPPAPTLTAATSFDGGVNLQWLDNTPNLLSFKIERAPDAGGVPGTWAQVATMSGGTSYFTDADTNLTAGATYWYRILAENWIGDSPYSGLAAVTINPPSAPAIASLSLNTSNGVDIAISDGADADGFLIERAVPSDLGFLDWTQIATINLSHFTQVYYTDPSATVNATNWYRVRAFSTGGISDYSPTASIAVTPPAPPGLEISSRSNSVFLSFQPNSSAEGVLGFNLQRAPDAGNQPGNWTTIATNVLNYSYIDSSLTVGALYWYRVQSFNAVGLSAFSRYYTVTISPPGTPGAPSAQLSVTNHQADVSWFDFFYDEDGYTVERAADVNGNPGSWSQIGIVYATNSFFAAFSDTNVTANTTNWYRVRAFSAAVVSDPSPATSLAAIAPATPIILGNLFGNTVTLSFYDITPTANSVGGFRLERAPDNHGVPGAWIIITNTPNSSYTDTGLAGDTTYWYRVQSLNWIGVSAYSDPFSVTATPPEKPSNLIAVIGAATNTVVIQWDDLVHDEVGFKIERSADAGGFPNDNWQEIGSVDALHADHASFIDTNVTAFTTNWYRVRAFSTTGFSDYTEAAEARIVPPYTPSNVNVLVADNVPVVWWDETFGPGIGGFVVQRAPDVAGVPGVWAEVSTNVATDMFYDDTGLSTPGIYWYRVRAFNWVGTSPYGLSVNASVASTPGNPAQPGPPSGSLGSTNQLILSWIDFAFDEDGFIIQRAADVNGAPGTWTQIGTITNSVYSSTFTDTNVIANTTNWYRVQAFNSVGVSDFSDSNSIAILPPQGTPTLFGTVMSAHHIWVHWETAFETIQGYKVERAPDVNGVPGPWTQIGDVSSSYFIAEFHDLAVAPNQKYWYRVRAYTWVGESPYSNELQLNDALPEAPLSLAVTNDQPHQFTLSWALTNSADITSIKIERAPDNSGAPGTWIQIAEPNTSGEDIPTNYTDIGIATGKTFWYRVRAVSAIGNSPYSNIASATAGSVASSVSALPTQPQILSLTQTNGGMLIEWSTTAGNTDMVQASGSFTGGYTNISPTLIISGTSKTTTNYFDAGALTNSPIRFYRIQSSR